MPCLPSSAAAEESLFKNEHAIEFAFNLPSTDAKRPSPELPAVVSTLQSSRQLDSWIVKPDAGNKQALATTDRMVYLRVILTHKDILQTTATQAAKDMRVIYSALCSISAKPQYRHLIWKDSLFKWTVGLANSKTARTNDVWYYTPSNCGDYRASSALGDLEGYLSKWRSDASFQANPPKITSGASAYVEHRDSLAKSTSAASQAMRKLADCMHDRDASAALESVASLYRANDEMQVALKGMLAVQTGTEKASSDMDDEKKDLKAFRDDASVDTLIGSLDDEMFDEKKTTTVPAPSRPGFFKRFLAKRQQKRSAKLTHVANEKLSKANKKIDKMDTALERLEGHYLYSINLHAHVMTEVKELVKLIQAATAEGGWHNVKEVLYHLHSDLYESDDGEAYELKCARDRMTKKLKKRQNEFQKLSGEIRDLLNDSDRLRVKADRLIASS